MLPRLTSDISLTRIMSNCSIVLIDTYIILPFVFTVIDYFLATKALFVVHISTCTWRPCITSIQSQSSDLFVAEFV